MMAESPYLFFRSVLRICSYFNPRTPVGCDCAVICPSAIASRFQSTHPSGVRLRVDVPMPFRREFQSTHPSGVRHARIVRHGPRHGISIHAPQWGATECLAFLAWFLVISIHAPQWGATIILSIGCLPARDFNPRTPVGCDHTAGKAFAFRHISIHAPQWGATTLFKGASGTVQFQSTHPSGVRPRLPPTCSTPLSFQSTHPSGVRR